MSVNLDEKLKHKALFNPDGDIETQKRRMIGGNTTNLNDFNNMKYQWVSGWYRQAMNNFWIPEEINLNQDIKDYPNAYRQFENEVTLPLHTRLTDEDVKYIIENFVEIIAE